MSTFKAVTRKAILDDLEGVMAIGNSYGGRDYMRGIFPRFVTDPKFESWVTCVAGEVVRSLGISIVCPNLQGLSIPWSPLPRKTQQLYSKPKWIG